MVGATLVHLTLTLLERVYWLFADEGRDANRGSLVLVEVIFSAELFEWRGPAPFYWLKVPDDVCDHIRHEAARATYGWGAVPVCVRIGGTTWETSLLPRDGGYLLPVRQAVRRREQFDDGDTVELAMRVAPRGGRAANGIGPTV